MRFQVLHDTHYIYSEPVHALAMEARLHPCTDEFQSCQRYRLLISPKAPIEEYTTFSDLSVQYWTLLRANEVRIISESLVDVRERPLTEIEVPPLNVDALDFYPYLHDTPLTRVTPDIRDFASQFGYLATQSWYQTAVAVRETLHETVEFQSGQTTTDTPASEVLQLRRGVCQDFTHLMIATLRWLGIPARYASGYLNQNVAPKPYQSQTMSQGVMQQEQFIAEAILEGEQLWHGTGASHAWCEVYFGPDHGWRGFDAANNLLVDQNFIRIGAGRDFQDVTPVKGVHKGPAKEELSVTVTVTRVG